jgi:iron complex outermembrane receptor protein
MRIKEISLLGSLISILVCGSMLYAAEASTDENTEPKDVFTLGEIVVTGKAETVTQVTTVETIDRSDIDLNNSVSLSSALDTLPGVAISIGTRNEASFNVRGFSQRYVPIFYDGIPWYVPYDGYADAGEISTGTVSRISLTKGTASSLYGANTMGGVINIISMKPQNRFESLYSFTMDTNGYSENLNLGSKVEKFYFMAGFSGLRSDAFRMSDNFVPIPSTTGWFEDGGDRDNSYSNGTTTSFKIGFTPAEGHEYAIGYHAIRNERGLPPVIYSSEQPRYWRFTDWNKTTYYLIGDSRISDKLTAKIRIYHDEYFNVIDAYDDSTYTTQTTGSFHHSTYDDNTDGGSIILRTDFINKNIISFAYHYKDDFHQSRNDNKAWEKYEGTTSSYGLEDAITISEKMDFVLGVNKDVQKPKYANGGALRAEDSSWNGLAGLIYYLGDAGKLHLSVANKSRFPSLKELYSSYLGTSLPNPNLKKEQSTNYEVGWTGSLPWDIRTGITFFYSDVKDLIMSTKIGGQNWYDNVGESRFQGAEFTFNTEYIPRNSIYLSYTYLDAENRTPNRTSDLMSDSPSHQFYISDSIRVTDRFSVFAKARSDRGQKEQKRNGTWTGLHSYWVVDLKALINFSEKLQLEAGVKNLFDRNYETSYGFPREGRTLFLGINGRFNN